MAMDAPDRLRRDLEVARAGFLYLYEGEHGVDIPDVQTYNLGQP
jgi:hypothetical protein